MGSCVVSPFERHQEEYRGKLIRRNTVESTSLLAHQVPLFLQANIKLGTLLPPTGKGPVAGLGATILLILAWVGSWSIYDMRGPFIF